MKTQIFFAILICMLFSKGYSQEPAVEVLETTETQSWTLETAIDDTSYKLIVYDKKTHKQIMLYKSLSIHNTLEESQEVKLEKRKRPVLFTQWNYGAHSEKILIFDPGLNNKPLYEIVSTYPATITAEKDRIHIEYTEEDIDPTGDEALAPVEKTVDWK